MNELLGKGLAQIGFSLEDVEKFGNQLEQYIQELYTFNKKFDLVGADEKEDIIVKHILDSLAGVPVLLELIKDMGCSDDFVIADIGTGGGLPGIPLACVMGDIQFVLVERMSRRCEFLQSCVAVMGLKNVTVLNEQAERLGQQSFDVAVFRAFRPLDKKMIRVLLRTLKKPHGILAAYKAKSEKIKEEMEGIARWAPLYSVKSLDVPFLSDRERNIVVIPSEQNIKA